MKDANHVYNVNRKITLEYNIHGKLKKISDLADRHWTLLHANDLNPAIPPSEDGAGAFVELRDPKDHAISMTYTPNSEIATISDKNGSAANPAYYYSFAYNNSGQLATVTDPSPFSNQVQNFAYNVIMGARTTTVTDRRGEEWTAAFEAGTGNFLWLQDPLLHTRSISYDETALPLIHEATATTDPLSRTWSVDYDAAANVINSTDPLGNKWTYAYDGLNNLLSVTPPGPTPGTSNPDKAVGSLYEDSLSPTSPTRIIEPRALPSDPPGDTAETTLEYYHEFGGGGVSKGSWGKLFRVTPAYSSYPMVTDYPVVTEYKYDAYGQPQNWTEGAASTSPTIDPVPSTRGGSSFGTNPAQGYQASCCDGNNNCTVRERDDNGRVIETICSTCKSPWLCTACGNTTLEGESALAEIEVCFPTTPTTCIPLYPGERDLAGAETGCAPNIAYNPNGEITSLTRCARGKQPVASTTRTFAMQYDELGRLTQTTITSNEATAALNVLGPTLTRELSYDYDDVNGTITRTGPDGYEGPPATWTVSTLTTDAAGRPDSFTRDHAIGGQLAAASVGYTDAGEVQTVAYGNGSTTDYIYDDAGRVDMIWHVSGDGLSVHLLDYDWSADGLVTEITEFDETGERASTAFTYDNRNRLIAEQRTGVHPYHFTYTYDKAGNRLTKTDVHAGRVTTYTYDVQNPAQYGSQNNRLVKSETTLDVNGQPQLKEENFYLYNGAGRVVYAVRKVTDDVESGQQWFTGTQIYYNSQGYVYLAWKLRWQLTSGGQLDNSTVQYVSAMKYRYDEGRQRYLTQRVDPRKSFCDLCSCSPQPTCCLADPDCLNTQFTYPYDPSLPIPDCWTAEEGKWSDYDGSSIHGDFKIDIVQVTPTTQAAEPEEQMAHEPGLTHTPWTGPAPLAASTTYLHGNLIGTTEAATTAPGTLAGRRVYTAFGEPINSSLTPQASSRYGYSGAWGYQGSPYDTGDPLADLGWLHVGARYYDPASGRFVQRDPLGIAGGLNVYVYAGNNPVNRVDPQGLVWNELGDFGGGFSSTLTFGLTDLIFDALGADIDKCSGWYKAGEVAGVLASIAGGALAGARAAAFRPGKDFSHFWPKRWGGPHQWWNGNYVWPRLHHRTDYWRRLDRGWRYPHGVRQLMRIPYPFSFGALGGLYGSASAATGGICGCEK